MTSSQRSDRFPYLDAIRSFALSLGIVFHASLSFMPMFIGWAVMDISTSKLVAVFVMISHSFRMELFFLIAGFFSHLAFHRKGSGEFIKSRILRIAVPFVIGWFLLRPLLVSGWVIGGESMRGDAKIFAGLQQGFESLMALPESFLVGTHLWFLYYLLLITAVTLLFRSLLALHTPLLNAVTSFADNFIRLFTSTISGKAIVIFATAICLWFMDHWGMDTPDKSLLPSVPVLLIYSGFFVFGWLLHRQPEQLTTLFHFSWSKLLLMLIAIAAALTLSSYEMQMGREDYLWAKANFTLAYATMMWLLVMLFSSACKRFFDKENSVVRYLADASYWVYLVHLPIVIWLQIAFAELAFHWSLKLIAICILTMVISLTLYQLGVRSTFIGKILNGRKQPQSAPSLLLKS